jgi:peptidyl-prolyl cis-trans isomerase SurA
MCQKFLMLFAAVLPLALAADNAHVVEEIVAKVNGDIVTRGDLDEAREQAIGEAQQQGITGSRLNDIVQDASKNALRNQIDQLLLQQKAKDLDVKVDTDVTKQLAEIQAASKITDPDKFHEYVRQQSGMSYEDFKQQMTNRLLVQKVVSEEITQRINIPEPELQKYYDDHKSEFVRDEQVYLSQILISTEGKTPEQIAAAKKKAADLVAQARKGERFSDLARKNSDDPETARDGGQLPPYKRGVLRKEIEDAVFQAKKGFVTDPIESPQGLLILKVDEHFEAGQASFEEVKDEIFQKLAQPKMEPRLREYLTKLRQDAYLQIKDGYVDAGAAPGKDTRWRDVVELKPETTTKEEVRARQKKKLLGVFPVGKANPAADSEPAGTASGASAPSPASNAPGPAAPNAPNPVASNAPAPAPNAPARATPAPTPNTGAPLQP